MDMHEKIKGFFKSFSRIFEEFLRVFAPYRRVFGGFAFSHINTASGVSMFIVENVGFSPLIFRFSLCITYSLHLQHIELIFIHTLMCVSILYSFLHEQNGAGCIL